MMRISIVAITTIILTVLCCIIHTGVTAYPQPLGQSPETEPFFDFETDTQEWQPLSPNPPAITSVEHTAEDAKSGSGSLRCYFDCDKGDTGAVGVTFAYPVDLRGKTLSVWVKFPPEADGIQGKIFIQDVNWAWADHNTDLVHFTGELTNTWVQLTWNLSTGVDVGSVDLSLIKRVGVIFGEWGSPPWTGYFYVDAFDWQPREEQPPEQPEEGPETPVGPPPEKMFRGVNIGNALEAPNEGDWGVYIRDEYFRIIRSAGFDTVRIPIKWSGHAEKDPPYAIDERFLNRVDHVVAKALEQNLIVILDMHNYDEIMQSPERHRDRFLSLWRQIAEHYKDYPENLYFELLNEPHGALTDEVWNKLVNETVKIIRETNPTRKIIIGPTNWNSIDNLGGLEIPAGDENIIVTFHYYSPFEFTHQGAEWVSPSPPVGRKWLGNDAEKTQIRWDLDKAVQWAIEHNNITLFLGEFGAYSRAEMESRVRWTNFVATEAEKRGIAWCYWEFCSGFGAYDPVKKAWRRELLDALTKYYVSVISDYDVVSGSGLYEKGAYATIRVNETILGFPIQDVFDHFEGLGLGDRVVDERTVEVYVDGPREIIAVWRKGYIILLLLVGVICAACLIVITLYKRRRPSG